MRDWEIPPDCLEAARVLAEQFHVNERLTCIRTAARLYEEARKIGPDGLCVEVGVWCGWTAAVMAAAGPTVLCVDTFRASDSWVDGDAHSLGVDRSGYKWGTLAHYARNICRRGLGHQIAAIQAMSLEAAGAMGVNQADLVFLDGNHNYLDVVGDIIGWQHVLPPGGVLCGDNWEAGNVSGAVERSVAVLGWPDLWHANGDGGDQLWLVRKPKP